MANNRYNCMKRLLSVLILLTLGIQLQAQDTLRTFTFAADDMTGISYGVNAVCTSSDVIGGETTNAHYFSNYSYSYWNRIADSVELYSTGFSSTYPYLNSWNYQNYMRQYLPGYNDGFMLASMIDYTWDHGYPVQYQCFNSYLAFPAITIPATVQVVEVAWKQLYRKYYDQCFVDYKVSGQWQTMEVNVTGIDVDVNGTAAINAHYTLPLAAAQESALELRLRYYSYGRGSAYGYCWAVDDFTVLSGAPNQWQVTPEHFMDGDYDIIPQGMQIPLTWYNSVKNTGAYTQTNVHVTMQHTSPVGVVTNYINEPMSPLTNHGEYDTLVIDPRGFYTNSSSNWVLYSPNYGTTSFPTVGNNGLPTTTAGLNTVQTTLSSDSLSHTYSERTYTVSTADSTGVYAWGYGNGILAGGMDGFCYGYTSNGYISNDPSTYYYTANTQVIALFTTGNTLPVDADGQPWVFRGMEMVVSPTCYDAEGTSLTPLLWKTVSNGDGSFYTPAVATGVSDYTVTYDDYTTLETGYLMPGEYNTLRIMFPTQPVLEPNTAYFIGYLLNDDAAFSLAVNSYSYYATYDSIAQFRDDSLMAPYAKNFPLNFGDVMTYTLNPYTGNYSWIYSGWNIDHTPMLRALVGPAVEIPQTVVTVTTSAGAEVYSNASSITFSGMGVDSVAIGSDVTYQIYPTEGYQISDILIDGVSIFDLGDYDFGYFTWYVTDSIDYSLIDAYYNGTYYYTFYGIDTNHTIAVTTIPRAQHSVTFNCPDSHAAVYAYSEANLEVSACGTHNYYSNQLSYYFDIDNGYEIDSLIVDGQYVDLGGSLDYTLQMNGTDHTLSLYVSELNCNVTTFPYTCGFESSYQVEPCWTYDEEEWMIDTYNSDFTHSGSGMMISFSGSYDYYTGEFYSINPDNWLITPAIQIPSGQGAILNWYASAYIGYESYSVYISTTGTDTSNFTLLGTYNVTNDGLEYSNYSMEELDLSAYAGQTVYIAFRHTDGDYVLFLDDVSIQTGNLVSVNCTGNGSGLVFHTDDYSAELCGTAEMIPSGFLASYDFIPTSGTLTHLYVNNVDHINDVVTHSSGTSITIHTYSFTVSSSTNIEAVYEFDCAVTTFPYTIGFEPNEHYNQCWASVSYHDTLIMVGDNQYQTMGGWYHNNGIQMAHSGSSAIYSFSGFLSYSTYTFLPVHPDNWLISPSIELPSGTGALLSWYEGTIPDVLYSSLDSYLEYISETYGVYVSTTGTDTADFTLLGEYTRTSTGYQEMSLNLSTYAGQTIHIAFRHTDGTFVLFLDDITVETGNVVNVNCLGSGSGTVYHSGDYSTELCGTTELVPAGFLASYDFIPTDGILEHLYVNTVDHINDVVTQSSGTSVTVYSYSFTVNEPTTTVIPVFSRIYTVTAVSSDPAMGMVTGSGTYSRNSDVTLTATPMPHYEFLHWLIIIDGDTLLIDQAFLDENQLDISLNPLQFPAMADLEVIGVFGPESYTITVAPNNLLYGSVEGGGTFEYLQPVTVSATAYSGYHFTMWSNGSTYNPYTFPASENLELTAIFVSDDDTSQYFYVTVTVNDATMGEVEGGGIFTMGDTAILTARPFDGYSFVQWNDGNTDNPRLVIVTSDANFIAYFTEGVGINDVDGDATKVYSYGKLIYVVGSEGRNVRVFDITGRQLSHVDHATETIVFTMQHTGVYVVTVGTSAYRVLVR